MTDERARDPQSVLYDRFVRDGEEPDAFSAKRLYPGLSAEDALARIRSLRAGRDASPYEEPVDELAERRGRKV